MTVVWMFPGQSSRYPEMIEKLVALNPRNAELLASASDYLGRDLVAHYRATNSHMFGCNRDVQIGVFLANQMCAQILADRGMHCDASLGLSLGEWNHIVEIGALPFRDALLAVEARGCAYDAGPRGEMVSVTPISVDALEPVLQDIRGRGLGIVEAVNLNSPRQQVIAGDPEAVAAALRVLEDEHFATGVFIERDVPMHCSTFAPVAEALRPVFAALPFVRARRPYLPNRTAQFIDDPQPAQLAELLSTHVCRPVLWRESIDRVVERYPDAVLVEVGPKAVLTNLLGRKWHPEVRKLCFDSLENTASHVEQVVAELRP